MPNLDSTNEDIENIKTLSNGKPEPDYPSDYFGQLNGKKPPFKWLTVDDPKKARATVLAGLYKAADLKIETVNAYLCWVAENWFAISDKEWKSYNVIIANKDEKIAIKDLFDASESRPITIAGSQINDEPGEGDDLWIVHAIFAIWRINSIDRKNSEMYRNQVMLRAKRDHALFLAMYRTKAGFTEIKLDNAADAFKNWNAHFTIAKLAAGFDMFYHRFNRDPRARVRFGTLITRYRGCAGLRAYRYVAQILRLEYYGDMLKWIYLECLADDGKRMFKCGQEFGDLYGYFPYMKDLCQIRKSAYSININQNLTNFVNFIGALKNGSRCQRAIFHQNTPAEKILMNAELVVYATRVRFMKVVQTRAQRASGVFKNTRDVDETGAPIPSSLYGDEFFLWVEGNNYDVPAFVHDHCSKCASGIVNPRKGSVGEWLKAYYGKK